MTTSDPLPSIFSHTEAPDADAVLTQSHTAPVRSQEVPLDDINPYDHSAEQAAIAAAQQEIGVAPPDMPTRHEVPVNNPGVMVDATKDVQEEIKNRFKTSRDGVDVTVSAAERDAFVRSALHDCELILDIQHPGVESTISVAIPPEMFTAAVVSALGHREASDLLEKGNTMQWFLLFQQMHVLFQIRKINGEFTPWAHLWEHGVPAASKLREILQNPDSLSVIDSMSAVRWRLCMDAIQTAEMKYALCMTNWRDRTFFTGADTA